MTRSTSPRSVKVTPKTDGEQASNGTPLTDPDYAVISVESPESARDTTGWTIQFSNGGVHHVRVKGGRGRISFSSARGGTGGELRVYRNESTKTFDAVFTDVVHVVSDRVETIPSKWGKGHGAEPRFTGAPPKEEEPKEQDVTYSFSTPSSWIDASVFKATKGKTRLKLNPED